MAELTDILSHNPDCVAREIGDGMIVMPPQGTAAHSLDDLGSFIWKQMDGSRDLATILTAVLSEYKVDEDRARTDLLAFADELLGAELIK